MPAEIFGENYQFLPHAEILSFEEVTRTARLASQLGVEKIRITGGEPMLRKDLHILIAQLSQLEGIRDIAMTTNGSMLAQKAQLLKDAGLHRVTVSLDAISASIFRSMNGDKSSVESIMMGIEAAQDAGLGVKVNAVIQKGVNEREIIPLSQYAMAHGLTLRFIEFMDTGNTNGWKLDQVMPSAEIQKELSKHYQLEELPPSQLGETALRFKAGDAELGFISSVTKPFCGDCTRARLSADGHLFTCLFAANGHDIKSLLRSDIDDKQLAARLAEIWHFRNDRYSQIRSSATHTKPEMSYLGG